MTRTQDQRRPDASAQHARLVLTVSPDVNGYRLAYAGGPVFLPVHGGVYRTHEAAWAAKREAERLSASINAKPERA